MKVRLSTNRVWLAALLGAAAAPCLAQISLGTVVDLAQRNSAPVRIAQADLSKATAVYLESRNAVIPSAQFASGLPAFPSVGFTGSPSSIWSVTVQSLVYSIPQRRYITGASDGVHAANANLKDAREQSALDASLAYIELDTVTLELKSAQNQEQDAARMVEIEQERAEAGVDPLNDLLQARLTRAQIRLKRIHLETRAAELAKQLASLTGLPAGTITPDHASIPQIPQLTGDVQPRVLRSVEAARMAAKSKLAISKGDEETNYMPRFSFFAQYNRNTTLLNNADYFYAHKLPADNFSSGFSIQVPLFDLGQRAKARESAADALRARVEAEQAERQNDVQIAMLTGSLRELDAQAEIATLQQQISDNLLKTVRAQLDLGNGQGNAPQLSPKAEQSARIDQGQKQIEAMDAGFELAKARLNLLRALGHMDDWLHTLNK